MKKFIIPTTLLLIMCMLLSAFSFAVEKKEILVEDLDISTYRGVSVGGILTATGGQGDITFEITTEPSKGCVDLNEDGHFVYTPNDGKKGKDYFGFKATDSEGNSSREATVLVRLLKQKTKVCYADMKNDGAEYAAVYLAEKGIFVGQCMGGKYVFSPDEPVTREEFLAMCMEAAGTSVLTGVSVTGFADDNSISVWAKPYAGTALKYGLISGYTDDMGTVFNGSQYISLAEASVILDKAMELTDAVATWSSYNDLVPVWASQAVANVAANDILPYGVSVSAVELTRAQAAEMLLAAVER